MLLWLSQYNSTCSQHFASLRSFMSFNSSRKAFQEFITLHSSAWMPNIIVASSPSEGRSSLQCLYPYALTSQQQVALGRILGSRYSSLISNHFLNFCHILSQLKVKELDSQLGELVADEKLLNRAHSLEKNLKTELRGIIEDLRQGRFRSVFRYICKRAIIIIILSSFYL